MTHNVPNENTLCEVDNPRSVIVLNGMPIFEWYVVWHGSKNIYQKDMFLKEIRPHAQHIMIIQGSLINITLGGGGRGTDINIQWVWEYSMW